MSKNLDEKFAVLKGGPRYEETSGYNTLKQAQNDGAVVMAYGYVFHLFCPRRVWLPHTNPSDVGI